MNEPSSAVQETTTKASARSSNAPVVPEKKTTPHSMRSRRTANWGKSHRSDDGHSGYNELLYFLMSDPSIKALMFLCSMKFSGVNFSLLLFHTQSFP